MSGFNNRIWDLKTGREGLLFNRYLLLFIYPQHLSILGFSGWKRGERLLEDDNGSLWEKEGLAFGKPMFSFRLPV